MPDKPRLDNIDKRILYHLASDARRTSAPDITEDLDVSAATVRNRITRLEEHGVIQGYHANIDYEKTGDRLTYIFICTTETPRREHLAREALAVPGVIQVRELMSGRRNLHIEAVGNRKAAITRIARDLANLGIEIEDEALLQRDYYQPYQPFGPDASAPAVESRLTNLHELAGDAKVLDITVGETAEAAGQTIRDLSEKNKLSGDLLIVAIERGEEIITPNGSSEIMEGDVVTVVSQEGEIEDFTELFTDPPKDSTSKPTSNPD